jgi:hypothetical protein
MRKVSLKVWIFGFLIALGLLTGCTYLSGLFPGVNSDPGNQAAAESAKIEKAASQSTTESEFYANAGVQPVEGLPNGTILSKGSKNDRGECVPSADSKPFVITAQPGVVKSGIVRFDSACNQTLVEQWTTDVSDIAGDRDAIRARAKAVEQEKIQQYKQQPQALEQNDSKALSLQQQPIKKTADKNETVRAQIHDLLITELDMTAFTNVFDTEAGELNHYITGNFDHPIGQVSMLGYWQQCWANPLTWRVASCSLAFVNKGPGYVIQRQYNGSYIDTHGGYYNFSISNYIYMLSSTHAGSCQPYFFLSAYMYGGYNCY